MTGSVYGLSPNKSFLALIIAWAVPVMILMWIGAVLAHGPAAGVLRVSTVELVREPGAGSADVQCSGLGEENATDGNSSISLTNLTNLTDLANMTVDTLPELDWGNATAPFKGLTKLNNATARRFFDVWWNATSQGKMLLLIPAEALGEHGVHFVVSAIVSRGDGFHTLLHEPLTDTDYNFFRFDLAPDGEGLDLVVPQLDLRPAAGALSHGASSIAARGANSSGVDTMYRHGAWSGWVRTFAAQKVTKWTSVGAKLSMTEAGMTSNSPPPSSPPPASLVDGVLIDDDGLGSNNSANNTGSVLPRCPVGPEVLWRVGTDPPKPSLKKATGSSKPAAAAAQAPLPCEPEGQYQQAGVYYLIDASDWLKTGAVVNSDLKLKGARLAAASAFPSNLVAQVQAHVELEKDVQDQRANGRPPVPLQMQISIAGLPPAEEGIIARAADDRIGYWVLHYTQIGSMSAAGSSGVSVEGGGAEVGNGGHNKLTNGRPGLASRRTNRPVRVIHRWRLEKAQPELKLSRPIRQIIYHIDPSVPERWRDAVARGVENWATAFEGAGFIDAIRAVRPGDADWPEDYSAGDVRYASISWAISEKSIYAIGPHTIDPRTGEILDADVMFAQSWISHWLGGLEEDAEKGGGSLESLDEDTWGVEMGAATDTDARQAGSDDATQASSGRRQDLAWQLRRTQELIDRALGENESPGALSGLASLPKSAHRHHRGPCHHGASRLAEAPLLHATLAMEGGLDERGEVPQAIIEAGITDVTMHEVGHTLGLRHNFRGSAAYPMAVIANRTFTAKHGIASSVMDYVPLVIPSNRSQQGDFFQSVVGAYDRLAIAYGYTPFDDEVSGEQSEDLKALAAQTSTNAELAFATDEDEPRTDGSDPLVSAYDLSSDPLLFYSDRLALSQQLLLKAANRTVLPGEPWTRQQHAILRLIDNALRSATYAAKYVGGFHFSKTHRGDGGGDPVTPVAAAEQARALQLVLQVLSQGFWLPAARISRRLPRRVGSGCGSLSEYCLGLDASGLLSKVHAVRKLVLMQLFQLRRLDGLAQHEWDQHDVEEMPRKTNDGTGRRQLADALPDTIKEVADFQPLLLPHEEANWLTAPTAKVSAARCAPASARFSLVALFTALPLNVAVSVCLSPWRRWPTLPHPHPPGWPRRQA